VISTDLAELAELTDEQRTQLDGRSMIVTKTEVVPIECVVRGYLSGSGWREYCESQSVCQAQLPRGLRESDQLPEPIFTPANKAESGHDENISFAEMSRRVGANVAEELRRRSLKVYATGRKHAAERGILIADTKMEWGWDGDQFILIDEVLTPDSSRFWPADSYRPGQPQHSYDKQFVRDWLLKSTWDRNSPPPQLPDDIVARTRERYITAFETLTGQVFPWG
jgi:phosphoribosylaminoimidazole-succinocarboxamide synthase